MHERKIEDLVDYVDKRMSSRRAEDQKTKDKIHVLTMALAVSALTHVVQFWLWIAKDAPL